MMELFVKNVNCYKPLTIFAKKTPSYIFVRLLNTNLDAFNQFSASIHSENIMFSGSAEVEHWLEMG